MNSRLRDIRIGHGGKVWFHYSILTDSCHDLFLVVIPMIPSILISPFPKVMNTQRARGALTGVNSRIPSA